MKFIIEISHPAHVHLFRYVYNDLQKHGHKVKIIARDKDVTLKLLQDYKIPYVNLSRQASGLGGLVFEMLQRDFRLWFIAHKFQPDIFLSLSMCSTQISALMRRISIILDDSEHATLERRAWLPFVSAVCTPDCYPLDLGLKHIRYAGYQELAYLHPNRYQPDPGVLNQIGLSLDEPYFILRFVSWGATHDIGQRGLSNKGKRRLIDELNKLGRVIITSESQLTQDFESYRLTISPTKIHDLLNYSTLYVGEGATMASEAAMLGVPSIYVNSITAATLQEQEHKYGLVQHIVDEDEVITAAVNMAKHKDIRSEFQHKRKRMLDEKIDVTDWLVKLVEGYQ